MKVISFLQKTLKEKQQGAMEILLSILVLNVMLIIGLGISVLMLSQIKMTTETGQSVVAFYAADAGAELCLYQARIGSEACSSAGGVVSGTLLGGRAFYSAVRANDNKITSFGQSGKTSRKVELTW